jgi:hypothetical protein
MYTFILCIFYNSTINTYKFKSSVEVYPIDVNPIEVYPIEAYLIGKCAIEVSGCILVRYPVCCIFSSAGPVFFSKYKKPGWVPAQS